MSVTEELREQLAAVRLRWRRGTPGPGEACLVMRVPMMKRALYFQADLEAELGSSFEIRSRTQQLSRAAHHLLAEVIAAQYPEFPIPNTNNWAWVVTWNDHGARRQAEVERVLEKAILMAEERHL